jgi:putative transposase
LCSVSKCLYNQAIYEERQSFIKGEGFLSYKRLNEILKTKVNLNGDINYRLLKAQVAQQNLMQVEKNYKGYFSALKEYKLQPNKFKGVPQPPEWNRGLYRQITFPNQSCSIKNGRVYFDKNTYINIPQYEKYGELLKSFNQVRINPKRRAEVLECEIVYTVQDTHLKLDSERYASIDLGVANFVTLVNDFTKPIIYSGCQIKSINQGFNKELSRLKSAVKKSQDKNTSRKITKLYERRDKKLQDLFHKVSKHIVDNLVKQGIGNLVVGYNEQWKDSIELGHKNNQTFVYIPYRRFLNYLRYKCEKVGIVFKTNEESYTSKCDALSFEEICKHAAYLGKRIKRGLFKSSVGKVLNADVNGALNIMRKVVDESYIGEIVNRGWLFQPVKFKNLYGLPKLYK